MKRFKLSSFWLLLLVTYSCNLNKDKGVHESYVRRTYYEDGTIRAEATYNSDSLKDGYGKLFYPDGQLELEIAYLNGKKEGYERGYYKDGSIKYIGSNKNDYPVGQHLSYYSDDTLKNYLLYDPVGRVVYKRNYDAEGEFISEEGSKNTQIISVTTTDNHFEVGDSLQIRIYAPTPPDINVDLIVKIMNKDDSLLEEEHITIEQGYASYSKMLKDIGSYYFTTSFFFIDQSTGKKERYGNNFQYWVK